MFMTVRFQKKKNKTSVIFSALVVAETLRIYGTIIGLCPTNIKILINSASCSFIKENNNSVNF